ncbi:MAG: hypothetical protein AAF639_31185 [Chloroflexota bacterium]
MKKFAASSVKSYRVPPPPSFVPKEKPKKNSNDTITRYGQKDDERVDQIQKLLDEGLIAYTQTGSEIRMIARDIREYKRECDEVRMNALIELVRMSEELGGYEELR